MKNKSFVPSLSLKCLVELHVMWEKHIYRKETNRDLKLWN